MKLNFLYQITAASRTPDLGATTPDLHSLCPQLNLLNIPPPEKNSWVRHCSGPWPKEMIITTFHKNKRKIHAYTYSLFT